MITATDLTMNFGGQTLFEGANLQLDPGKRYGIVGGNGSGKSTLLRILAGEMTSTGGDVSRPRAARIGTLEQDHFRYEDIPILDVVMMGNPELWNAMVEKEAVLDRAEVHFDEGRYNQLEDIVLRFDGYGLESRAGQILEGLGIPTAVHRQPLRTLSGGFKLRALLARTLASEPDLLFLDEPTNHLDILAIKWLEEFLTTFRGTAAVVSHDHRFMDAVCTDILDVDYGRITAYRGNYSAFLARKEEHADRMETEISKRQKEIDEHKAFIARFAAKATKARQANSRQKRMEKIVIEHLPPSSRRYPRFRFTAQRQSGRDVLTVTGVSKSYGDKAVLKDVSFAVQRGDRIAILGQNGIGKSTLLKICVGALKADAGTAAWGYETHPGYFPQDHAEALGNPDHQVSACLWELLPEEGLGAVLSRLALMLFNREDADKKVGNLSGGEGARLLFSRIAAAEPNVLVLDEPTNHLDLESIEALTEALSTYDGTLIFVSHDRWFVDRLATRILEIGPEGVNDFHGNYADFLARASTDHLDREAVLAEARKANRKRKPDAEPETAAAEPERPAWQAPSHRDQRGTHRAPEPSPEPAPEKDRDQVKRRRAEDNHRQGKHKRR
jgi:ATPase subunit of ABC transporter with duplicated ATPase domains